MILADLERLEQQLSVVEALLVQPDPDPDQVLASIQTLMDDHVAPTDLNALSDEQRRAIQAAIERIEHLRLAALKAAQDHRERLSKTLASLDHAAIAIRRYAPHHSSSAHFIDQTVR